MGVNYFTEEQVKYLNSNIYVKKASKKAITYEDSFKEHFVSEYNKGISPSTIFKNAGLSRDILGIGRIKSSSKRFRKISQRLSGFKDTRSESSGRPRTKHLTKDEIIKRQQAPITYLKQKREFLLELKRL